LRATFFAGDGDGDGAALLRPHSMLKGHTMAPGASGGE
jgi:hypothetical protein